MLSRILIWSTTSISLLSQDKAIAFHPGVKVHQEPFKAALAACLPLLGQHRKNGASILLCCVSSVAVSLSSIHLDE